MDHKEIEKIVARVKLEAKNDEERVGYVLREVIERFNYVGDWRTVEGAYIPREISEIFSARYGDCKDFSIVTHAILKKMGFKSELALTYRQARTPFLMFKDLPLMSLFNHMVVYVEVNGAGYYIDPTNVTAYFRNIPADISNRYALRLSAGQTSLVQTPKVDFSTNVSKVEIKSRPLNDSHIMQLVKIGLSGNLANQWMGRQFSESMGVFQRKLLDNFFYMSSVLEFKLTKGPQLQRWPRKDVEYVYEIKNADYDSETTLGRAYFLSKAYFNLISLSEIKEDRETDLWLTVPQTHESHYILEKIKFKGELPAECKVENAYFHVSRSLESEGLSIRRKDKIVVKESVVPNSVLKSSSFRKDVKRAADCRKTVLAVAE